MKLFFEEQNEIHGHNLAEKRCKERAYASAVFQEQEQDLSFIPPVCDFSVPVFAYFFLQLSAVLGMKLEYWIIQNSQN